MSEYGAIIYVKIFKEGTMSKVKRKFIKFCKRNLPVFMMVIVLLITATTLAAACTNLAHRDDREDDAPVSINITTVPVTTTVPTTIPWESSTGISIRIPRTTWSASSAWGSARDWNPR